MIISRSDVRLLSPESIISRSYGVYAAGVVGDFLADKIFSAHCSAHLARLMPASARSWGLGWCRHPPLTY